MGVRIPFEMDAAFLNGWLTLSQVVPSNVDIATVDIIEMAGNADPQGERTIGVVTKPDLIDQVRAVNPPSLFSRSLCFSLFSLFFSLFRPLSWGPTTSGMLDFASARTASDRVSL